MIARLWPVALAGIVWALSTSPALAALADQIGNTFALMADDVVTAFQPLEALVIQVDGDVLYLDVGGSAAQIGQEFMIFRKGEVFRHPLTDKPLGRYEAVLGHAQIRRVQPQFSEAVFIPLPDKPRPLPEDGARITRGRIKVAVTPVLDMTNSQADFRRVPYMFATILDRSKRFQVVDPLTVSDMLATASVRVEEVLARPDRAGRAARSLEVAGWLVPILLERRGVTYLDVTWISAITGRALFSRRMTLLPASAAEAQRFPWEPRGED